MDLVFQDDSIEKIAETATTVNEPTGITAGSSTFTVTDATGFTVGSMIKIGVGHDQEFRRILAVATNDITITAFDKDHADAEAVEVITEANATPANYATCRTNLLAEDFEFYIEDTYGDYGSYRGVLEWNRYAADVCGSVDEIQGGLLRADKEAIRGYGKCRKKIAGYRLKRTDWF